MSGGIIFYGDPHGEWQPLLRSCREERPEGVVLLGDCDLDEPLGTKLRTLFDDGILIKWVPGNHDASSPVSYDFLWGDCPDGNIHAARACIGGLSVVGLGGIFKGRVWYPRTEDAEPRYASREECLESTKAGARWRGGLPLSLRDAIFPEDIAALDSLDADVLVTHEAPSTHRRGFVGIDDAAERCHARFLVHGHHHKSYEAVLPTGVRVRGLAKAEVFRLRVGDVG